MKAVRRLTAICLIGAMTASVMGCGATVKNSEDTTQNGTESSSANTTDSDAQAGDAENQEAQEAALIINGEEIRRSLYDSALTNALAEVDPADTVAVQEVKDNLKDQIIRQTVVSQYYLESATDEEKAEIEEEVEQAYQQQIVQYVMAMAQQGMIPATMSEEESKTMAESTLKDSMESQGLSIDLLKEDYRTSATYQRAVQKVKEEISVSDEDAKAWYDEQLLAQRTEFATNPYSFDQAMNMDPPMALTAPAGYGYVKQVLIQLSNTEKEKVQTLQQELMSLSTALSQNIVALSPDMTKRAELETEIAAKKTEILAQYDSIRAAAEDVLNKAKAGENFDQLIETYGDDEGMKMEPTKTKGYLVGPGSMDWATEFRDAGLKLTNVGDISDLAYTQFGIHIIKKISEIPEGDFPYEEVKDVAVTGVQTQNLNDAITAKSDELVEKAKVEDLT